MWVLFGCFFGVFWSGVGEFWVAWFFGFSDSWVLVFGFCSGRFLGFVVWVDGLAFGFCWGRFDLRVTLSRAVSALDFQLGLFAL